jgi:hypothetical protein
MRKKRDDRKAERKIQVRPICKSKTVARCTVTNIALTDGATFLRISHGAQARGRYCLDREAKGRYGGQKSTVLNLQDS